VTATYLSVNTVIAGVIAFLLKDARVTGWALQVSVLILLAAGVIACDLWRRLITQHSVLSSWWYERLRELEDTMPESSKLLTREYQALCLEKRSEVRIGLTRYETRLTWLFTALYAAFGLAIVTAWTPGFVQ
jgi:hypothetical protein